MLQFVSVCLYYGLWYGEINISTNIKSSSSPTAAFDMLINVILSQEHLIGVTKGMDAPSVKPVTPKDLLPHAGSVVAGE